MFLKVSENRFKMVLRVLKGTLERYNRSGVEGWKPEFPALSNTTC